MTDDYSNHPPSITEIKSDKTRDGSKWTPRDALIALLRDIDSGKASPDAMIIICGKYEENRTFTSYYQSTKNVYETLGLLEDGKVLMTRCGCDK